MTKKVTVRVRRVYDEPADDDGIRVLVDRVWPRGMRKEAAHLDEWCKQVAPSTELRTCMATTPISSPNSVAVTTASCVALNGSKR